MVDPSKNTVTKKLWSFIKVTEKITLVEWARTVSKVKPLAKTNIFANYFSSVYTNEDTSFIATIEGNPLPSIDSIQVHTEGVAELLSNIDPKKANGPDNLPVHFLKEVSYEIAPALTLTFQAFLNKGTLPEVWKQALAVPVFKKGSRSDPCNFRPISLTCICTKLLEHIVYSNVSKHLQKMKFYVTTNMVFMPIEAVTSS